MLFITSARRSQQSNGLIKYGLSLLCVMLLSGCGGSSDNKSSSSANSSAPENTSSSLSTNSSAPANSSSSANEVSSSSLASSSLTVSSVSSSSNHSVASTSSASSATQISIMINTGGSAAGDWSADTKFSGGTPDVVTNTINTSLLNITPPQAVLRSERYGDFTYVIDGFTPDSTQTISLFFVESYWTAVGERSFNVVINGETVLSAFDILAEVGEQYKAIQRDFQRAANGSGQYVIAFQAITDLALINGIYIGNHAPMSSSSSATSSNISVSSSSRHSSSSANHSSSAPSSSSVRSSSSSSVGMITSGIVFDDFDYTLTSQMSSNGWYVRSGGGGPGVGGASWAANYVTFLNDPNSSGNRLMRMRASTQGTGATTVQSQVTYDGDHLRGTYAARMYFNNQPAYGVDGDHIVETFYTITPLVYPMDPDYSEIDFEYLANGGWGQSQPTMFLTTWETYQAVPWVADNIHTAIVANHSGWRTLVAQVDATEVRYYIDGVLRATHSGKYYPETEMSLNFNIWFIEGGLLNNNTERAYEQDVDWVYFIDQEILSPQEVQTQINLLQQNSVSFTDTVN